MANAKQRRRINRAVKSMLKARGGKMPALPAPPKMVRKMGRTRSRARRPRSRARDLPPLPPVPNHTVTVQEREVPWWETALNVVGGIGHALIPLIRGPGDYTVHSNSLMAAGTSGRLGGEVPRLSNTATHNVISHREYLGDILSTNQDFVVQYYSINPGLLTSFPWCSPIANSYQQYRIKGMVFEFKTLATDYSAQPYIGYVAMATQYDSYDPPFNSKLALDNCEYACSRKTNESFLHPIECARDQTTATELYVRNSAVTGGDARLYDWGQFCIAVGGQSTPNVTIGELWVTYEIEFFKPKLASEVGFNALSVNFLSGTGVNSSNPLGTGGYGQVGSIQLNNITSTGFQMAQQDGIFWTFYCWTGSVGAIINYPSVTWTGASATTIAFAPAVGETATKCILGQIVIVKAGVGYPSVSIGTSGVIPTGSTSISLYISQVAEAQALDGPVVSRMRARGKNKVGELNEKDVVSTSEDDDEDLNALQSEVSALMNENVALRDEITTIKQMLMKSPMWTDLANYARGR